MAPGWDMAKLGLNEELFGELFELRASTRQKTMMKIVEAAIQNYASLGVEETTYDSIAKTCRVSRPLVHKYFPSKKDIFLLAIKYIRLSFQRMAIAALDTQVTPQGKLVAYVESTFEWIETRKEHVKVWGLFQYQSMINREMMAINTEMARVGHTRITRLLEYGNQVGVFKSASPFQDAKQIQTLITGALMIVITESSEPMNADLKRATIESCFRIVGAEAPR